MKNERILIPEEIKLTFSGNTYLEIKEKYKNNFYYFVLDEKTKKQLKDILNNKHLDENLIKTKRKPPFKAPGKTEFKIKNRPGVYLIYKKDDLVYVGFSRSNLYKALYRHFYPYKDKIPQDRVNFNPKDKDLTVRVLYTKNGLRASRLESALILKHKPKLNANHYAGFELDDEDKNLISDFEAANITVLQPGEKLPF